ncbi:helix-turn-helix domain-containing protein [Pedobacter kyungheensis]|uniref:helix-turn-helix domain-containing protein n=1 Tax=Pedobacter kyungheensis TaxID=1069985 RepID=UPI00068DC8C5|nr:helix-turn-helix domain-containing protein [Pedobacter kyungheensis]
MSSNLKILRKCEYCNQTFIAKKTVTRFCGKVCNSRYYKSKTRADKVQASDLETVSRGFKYQVSHLDREVLSVAEVAGLLRSHRGTVYGMINSGALKAAKIHTRKTVVLREDFLSLFDQQMWLKTVAKKPVETQKGDDESAASYYTTAQVIALFGKSREAVYTMLQRSGIQKVKVGKEILIPKDAVDRLYKQKSAPRADPLDGERRANQRLASKPIRISDCYSIEECVQLLGKERGLLYAIFKRRNVPKLRVGQYVYYLKRAVDKIPKDAR